MGDKSLGPIFSILLAHSTVLQTPFNSVTVENHCAIMPLHLNSGNHRSGVSTLALVASQMATMCV